MNCCIPTNVETKPTPLFLHVLRFTINHYVLNMCSTVSPFLGKKHINLDKITIDAERLVNQRQKDCQALLEQRKHIDVLIKMVGKISEMIHGEFGTVQ